MHRIKITGFETVDILGRCPSKLKLNIEQRTMPHRTATSLSRKWWLDYTLFCFSGKFCPVPEDYIRDTIRNLGDCETATRYYDFFTRISSIMRAGRWDVCRLEQLLESFNKMEYKYGKCAMDEPDWFDLKLDTLFQIYLCLLRDAVGVEDDNLPDTLSAKFPFSDSLPNEACRSKIDALMEKYKSYYLKKNDEIDILDVRYEQHRTALMESLTDKTILFQLLQAHRVEVFKQKIVTFVQSVEEKVLPIPEGCTSAATGTGVRDHLHQQLQSQLPISTPPKYKRKFEGDILSTEPPHCKDSADTSGRGASYRSSAGDRSGPSTSAVSSSEPPYIQNSTDTDRGPTGAGTLISSSTAAGLVTSSPLYVQRRVDIEVTEVYWGPAATAAITAARDAANKSSYEEYLQMEEQKKRFPLGLMSLSQPRDRPKRDVKAALVLSDVSREAREQTVKFREKVKTVAAGTTGDGESNSLYNSSSSGSNSLPVQPQVEADSFLMSYRESDFALMYIAREKLLEGGSIRGEVPLEGALLDETDPGFSKGESGKEFNHVRGVIYGIPYTKTTCTVNEKPLQYILTDDDVKLVLYGKVLPISEGCTCTSAASGKVVREPKQQLQSQLPISTSPKYKRKFDGVDVNKEGGTTENGRGGESGSKLHETLIEHVVEASVAAGTNAISSIITSGAGNASQTSPSARITILRDMPRLQRRADIASGWKYWGPTGVAAIAAATAADRQRYAEECAERKLNPPVMKPRSTEPHVKRDFSSTFRLSDMKIEARKETKKFREQILAPDRNGNDHDTAMSSSSHNSSSSNSNNNKGTLSTLDSYFPTNPYARHSAVKMQTGSAGSESPDATSSAAAASATNGTASDVEAAAFRRLAQDPTMLFQRKTEFSLMYHHREKLLAVSEAEEGTGDDTMLAEPEVTNTGTTTGDTGNVFHHLRSDIYGIPYTKTTCTVNGRELELILTDDDLELVNYKK